MTKQEIFALAADFVAASPLNIVNDETMHGLRLFDAPLCAVASAADPLFEEMKRPEVIGAHYDPPETWLPGAKSVICFFLPFSADVRRPNAESFPLPAKEWLYGRVEGQAFIDALSAKLRDAIIGSGAKAVSPFLDPRFWTVTAAKAPGDPEYTSNWSERHAAYAAGLGTFSLSKGLITRAGIAGRFGSVITDLPLEADTREYTELYEYCIMCGACAPRCPAGAISLEHGKDHAACSSYFASIRPYCTPRYGCGKCQTAVPCEHTAPGRKAK